MKHFTFPLHISDFRTTCRASCRARRLVSLTEVRRQELHGNFTDLLTVTSSIKPSSRSCTRLINTARHHSSCSENLALRKGEWRVGAGRVGVKRGRSELGKERGIKRKKKTKMKFNNHIYFILNTAKYKDSESPLVSSNTHFTKRALLNYRLIIVRVQERTFNL